MALQTTLSLQRIVGLLLYSSLSQLCFNHFTSSLELTCQTTTSSDNSLRQGVPGKRGPIGPIGLQGPPGPKGEKGEPGSDVNVQVTLRELRQRVEELEAKLVSRHPTSCSELSQRTNVSGVYRIYPYPDNYGKGRDVFCDMEIDGGGWMKCSGASGVCRAWGQVQLWDPNQPTFMVTQMRRVIQRRVDASVNFQRTWNEYANGFGELRRNYWFGLNDLHAITSGRGYELRVDLQDFNDAERYAKYRLFQIRAPSTQYRLVIDGYSGDAGNSLAYHANKPFSTKDRDNDNVSWNCATTNKGAWWFGHGSYCYQSNLNGILYTSPSEKNWLGVVWNGFHAGYSLQRAEMKIRIAE